MATQKNEAQQQATGQAVQKTENPLALIKKSVVDVVKGKVDEFINSGQLVLPKDYSPDNAMKAAWLVLQQTVDKDKRPALEVCTRDSVANALLDMVVRGLNPIKKQNYFIVYGKTLVCQRSYFGSMVVAKMVQPKIDDFAFAVVYQGDKFSYGIRNGKKIIATHEQDIENVDKKKIVAAYCIALDKNGEPYKTEIMTFEEILQAWKQSTMNPFDDKGGLKQFSTHGKFTSDMALKTVINKCCKAIINASSDNTLLLERINKNGELTERVVAEQEIEENGNKGPTLEIMPEAEEESEEPEQEAEQKEPVECPLKRAPGF